MPTSINCKPFMIYLIQHSHIDVGYTERQEVIAEYQRQFIGQAVRLATAPQQRLGETIIAFASPARVFGQLNYSGTGPVQRRNCFS